VALATLNAAIKLHKHMLSNITRNEMAFFDTTPIGRILNRFSKDVDVLDNILPMLLRGLMMTFFSVQFPFNVQSKSKCSVLFCLKMFCFPVATKVTKLHVAYLFFRSPVVKSLS
jgi:ABC-type multidrug transport system fused ATPase/permease subunit